jgi:hypothetical protein
MYNIIQEVYMNKLGYFLLNIAVALYLFANGVIGLNGNRWGLGDKRIFYNMLKTIFGTGNFTNVLTIVLSVCAIVAGVFLLLSVFKNDIALTEIILLVFIILWVIFIVIVDIINPLQGKGLQPKFLEYLTILAAHLMVLGALVSSTRRFGNV